MSASDEKELRKLVVETGRELLRDGLVARTWGNVSARVDKDHFLITPSGLSYLQTKEEDLALYQPSDKSYQGPRKPSSEKGIHAAAYEIFEDVNFVIHTHQTFASAQGVWGWDQMDISEEEQKKLGGLCAAEYGLPGTCTLKKAVTAAFATGAHTVLMKHHGAVIAAASKEEAFERAVLLEEICKRNICGFEGEPEETGDDLTEKQVKILDVVKKKYPLAQWTDGEASRRWSLENKVLTAQLDDMAQMIGKTIDTTGADPEEVLQALSETNSVFVNGLGAVVCGNDEEDTDALKILVEKAATCALHTMNCDVKKKLGAFDCFLMHLIYQKKYSAKKNG